MDLPVKVIKGTCTYISAVEGMDDILTVPKTTVYQH